jgi:hypothetical protein
MTDETNKRPEHVRLVEEPPAESIFDDIAALRKVSPLRASQPPQEWF